MIYEMRTYNLKPHAVPEFEKRFGEALPYREKYSPLGALWYTEIGRIGQVIHVWPYQSIEERKIFVELVHFDHLHNGGWWKFFKIYAFLVPVFYLRFHCYIR